MRSLCPLLTPTFILAAALTASAVDVTVQNDTFLSDSVWEFSTTQGVGGWNYGYYDLSVDGVAGYDPVADFQLMAVGGPGYAVGGNPPWTNIGSVGGHPNGTNNGAEHWAIRRYTIQPGEGGSVSLSWFLRDTGPGGDGVVGAIYHNGVEVGSQLLEPGNTTGLKLGLNLNVAPGDKIDLALKPNVGDANDSAEFGMRLFRKQELTFSNVTLIADSAVEFSGVQGQNGWTYGQYDITGGGTFQEFTAGQFDGGKWDVAPNVAPWTEVGSTGGHPNGVNNGSDVWATRRYTVQSGEAGNLLVEWNLAKGNPSGDGTTVRILLNGALVDAYAVEGTDTTGLDRGVVLENVAVGDVIDIALSAQGAQNFFTGIGDAANDGSDGSVFGARIYAVPEPGSALLLMGALGMVGVRRRRMQGV